MTDNYSLANYKNVLGQTKIHQVDILLFVLYYNYMHVRGYYFFYLSCFEVE